MKGCGICDAHRADPLTRGACASVGIEHNMDTDEVLEQYLDRLHRLYKHDTLPA